MFTVNLQHFFLCRPDNLYVRCQLHPWCERYIIVSLNSVLVPQEVPVSKRAGEIGVTYIDIVEPYAEFIQGPSGDNTLAPDSYALEIVNGVCIAI